MSNLTMPKAAFDGFGDEREGAAEGAGLGIDIGQQREEDAKNEDAVVNGRSRQHIIPNWRYQAGNDVNNGANCIQNNGVHKVLMPGRAAYLTGEISSRALGSVVIMQ